MTKKLVVHVKRDKYDVYIGRPSPFGNPFHIGPDGTREEVIQKYEEYARKEFTKKELRTLKDKVLACWCAPLPCHGDALVKLANEAAEDKLNA